MNDRGGYNFASSQYRKSFKDLPVPNVDKLREDALTYLKGFDPQVWYDDPVTSILKGEKLTSGTSTATIDAFGNPNGKIRHATPAEVSSILSHTLSYKSPYSDLRTEIRSIESQLLGEYSGLLIGNQAMDFYKQDGVTEMEESIMANEVERRLNDALLEDEGEGRVKVKRNAAFVGCVSNFSNFLDLFRKVIRNLEVGVPVVVLSRSNTTQHMYRWSEILNTLIQEQNIDPGMLTYASCHLDHTKELLSSNPDSPMYVTCSRDLAKSIKSNHYNTIASTGGPNTLLATRLTPQVAEAISLSATIESSGQCTALRHVVLPEDTDKTQIEHIFDRALTLESTSKDTMGNALRTKSFAGIFRNPLQPDMNTYRTHSNPAIHFKINEDLPPDDMREHWRNVVVDVTASINIPKLTSWLVRNQPISCAINVSKHQWDIAKQIFNRTGLVVYTVGTCDDSPALTCQARPQEAEVFGEFPPRRQLHLFTKFPVLVPSSTPSYDSSYLHPYLTSLSASSLPSGMASQLTPLLHPLKNHNVRGYAIELANYLHDALSSSPGVGYGVRTSLWGWQRPPLVDGTSTVIRCAADLPEELLLDAVLPYLIPFAVTNARSQLQISVDPCYDNSSSLKILKDNLPEEISIITEDQSTFSSRMEKESPYNVLSPDSVITDFPMLSQFMSLLFPLGHIKSTEKDHVEFVEYFSKVEKWLKLV